MTDERTDLGLAIESGLREALAWKKGELALEARNVDSMPPERIRAIMKSAAKTAKEFERLYAIPAATLNNWLQGRRHPDPASRAYLIVIEKAPDTVRKALAAAPSTAA